MNVLAIASRFPWPAHSGDRVRTSTWLEALQQRATVALVTPPGELPSSAAEVRFFPAAPSAWSGLRGAMRVIGERLPVQTLLAAPFDWSSAIAAAQTAVGDFDTTIVILSRCDPWVRPLFPGGRHILDSIDSLRRNAAERRKETVLLRGFWAAEERRLARMESGLPNRYDEVIVVSEEETSEFGGEVMTIPNSVPIRPLRSDAVRPIDVAFWGRLAYFANADAARRLLDEVVPAIRERAPSTRFAIGGADAPRALRVAAARAGVQLVSPLDEVAAFARQVRVALVPMQYGSGQSSKLLEAAEAGCATVATPAAIRGLRHIAPHVIVAGDTASLAGAAVELLKNETKRREAGDALRRAVELHHARTSVLDRMAEIAGAPIHDRMAAG